MAPPLLILKIEKGQFLLQILNEITADDLLTEIYSYPKHILVSTQLCPGHCSGQCSDQDTSIVNTKLLTIYKYEVESLTVGLQSSLELCSLNMTIIYYFSNQDEFYYADIFHYLDTYFKKAKLTKK